MEDFKIIYRILFALHAFMGCEQADGRRLSPEALKTTREKRDALLCLLADDGYISGLDAVAYVGDTSAAVDLTQLPKITLKGLEYLEDNGMMKRAARMAKGIVEVIK